MLDGISVLLCARNNSSRFVGLVGYAQLAAWVVKKLRLINAEAGALTCIIQKNSHIRATMEHFKNIALVANTHISQVRGSVQHLTQFLKGRGLNVWLEDRTAAMLGDTEFPVLSEKDMAENIDLIMVIGGDGSMLAAARKLVKYDVPMLGINRGRLGFLTDILPGEIETEVARVLAGEFKESSRFLLNVDIKRNGEVIATGDALNDIVLHPGKSVRMMEFELYIDGQIVYSQRSDGLIISTPTGSTAYALSGGGPILHPGLDAIGLVPMNPHTLTSRPIVVSGDSDIEIRVGSLNELHPRVACDGQNDLSSEPGDVIHIRKKPKLLRLIHPIDHNFYETCRSKLGWSSRLDSNRNDD